MFKNNNVNSAKCEENKNVIRISDYYPQSCSEQEYITVSDEVLAYLSNKKREEQKKDKGTTDTLCRLVLMKCI